MSPVVSVTLSNITQLVLSHNKLTGKLLPVSSALSQTPAVTQEWKEDGEVATRCVTRGRVTVVLITAFGL